MYKKLTATILVLILILLFGTLGYVIIEKWSFFDSLYMTVITLATVGYGEVHPLTTAGRIFTIFLILCGVSILLYAVSSITSFFIEGELTQIFRRKKMLKTISELKNHFIVCGAGEVGNHIISELSQTERNFVIVEKDANVLKKYENNLCINGDAGDENILKEAGISRAAGMFAALPTDEDNIFLIITAREINTDLKIVAKVVKDLSAKKLKAAGADSVVLPSLIGGMRMASEMVRPAVVSFLDSMLKQGKGDLRVEEVEITRSLFKMVSEIPLNKTGVLLLAVKKDGDFKFNPPQNTSVRTSDKLIVMGSAEQISQLRNII